LLDEGLFRALAPVASIAAVLVILFDGGLDIRLQELRRGAGPSVGVAVVAFVGTAVLAGIAAASLLAMSPSRAALLGMCFGGAGVAIVIPLIQRMDVGRPARALVNLETAVSDVLLVVGVFSLAAALAQGSASYALLGLRMAAGVGVAVSAGVLAAMGWVRLLDAPWSRGHESLATVGALFLVYVATETLHGSGPLAVLCFALVLGNSRHAADFTRTALGIAGPPTFHQQAALAIRAFVFVGLGATLDLHAALQPRLLAFAALACLAVIASRVLAIAVAARRVLPSRWDRTAVTLMFPLGLPTAAASLIPYGRFGLAGTSVFPQVAALVILLSIMASSLLVAVALHPAVRRRLGAPPPTTLPGAPPT
jgi:NhaP-type Na+/H+ or K+/H+ antiporter